MKKVLIAGLLIMTMLYSAFSASTVSWEGRAAVGSTGIFPGRGMYALSRVFSTGEIVEVYNPVNQKKVTVVISNNTDLSGILVLLSPEAAEALSIVSGSDSVVRVSKIPEYALQGTTEESAEPEVYVEDSELIATENPESVEIVALDSTELTEEPVVIDEPVEDETLFVDDSATDLTEEPVVAAIDEEATITDEIVSYSLLPAEELPPEYVVTEEIASTTEVDSYYIDEPVEDAISYTSVETAAVAFDSSELVRELEAQGEEIEILKAEVATQERTIESLKETIETQKNTSISTSTYTLSSSDGSYASLEKTLQKGSYYVQFAYLADKKNIEYMIDQYESRYPLVMNKKDNGYQMLVGPLSATEYRAVEEQFKGFGFRDTFSKRIN